MNGDRITRWVYNDGGRSAHFSGKAGDCVTRAIAIATGLPYKKVYDDLFLELRAYRATLSGERRQRYSSPRNGYPNKLGRAYMGKLGWEWTPTMRVGQGTKVHLRADELPSGTLIVRLSHHWAAVINGVLHDTHDCARNGTRCVYGYWTRPNDWRIPTP